MTESTITNWELNRTKPELRFIPAIIRFLSYLPFPPADSIGKQLTLARTVRGLSREAAAQQLGVDPGTLWKWESGGRTPGRRFLAQVQTFLASAREHTHARLDPGEFR